MASHYQNLQRLRLGGSPLFSDPGWSMLVELFIARLDGRLLDKSSAYIASGSPHSTGHRWARRLEKAGLVYRRDDPTDARRGFFILTDGAMSMIADWMRAMFHSDAESNVNVVVPTVPEL